MRHCTASARVRLLAVPLVQPHPTPSLHQRRLYRRVRGLQAMPEVGILRVGEPVGSVCLQSSQLSDNAEMSRAVSLARSFGSCGPTYATTGGATRPC